MHKLTIRPALSLSTHCRAKALSLGSLGFGGALQDAAHLIISRWLSLSLTMPAGLLPTSRRCTDFNEDINDPHLPPADSASRTGGRSTYLGTTSIDTCLFMRNKLKCIKCSTSPHGLYAVSVVQSPRVAFWDTDRDRNMSVKNFTLYEYMDQIVGRHHGVLRASCATENGFKRYHQVVPFAKRTELFR